MRKRVFFQNAAILTVTSLLLRSIGIFFRIYVSNRVGAEGMGLYQLIVSVYALVASFAVAGLNTAVTRLCTDALACDKPKAAKRVLYYAIVCSVIFGVFTAFLLLLGTEQIAVVFLKDSRAIPSLRILTVSLPFMGASSCIKGYFMARRKVTASSIAQITEQVVRIIAIVSILELYAVDSIDGACFAILLGDVIAEAVSCLYMIGAYFLDKRHLTATSSEPREPRILRKLLAIAAPITGGRYINSGLRTIENVMVPTALEHYTVSRATALEQFGKLKGMALPLIFFPSSFLTAFTALLIPEISEAKALGQTAQLSRTTSKAIHLTLLSAILIGGVFWKLAYPLGELLYHDREVGMMIRVLATLAPVMYLESVVVGILKGLDQQTHSLIYSVVDSICRIALIVILTPHYGIYGFLAVMVVSNLLTCLLNLYRLCKVTCLPVRIGKWIIRPLLAIGTAIAISAFLDALPGLCIDDPFWYCITNGGALVIVFLVLCPILGCIDKNDFVFLKPKQK